MREYFPKRQEYCNTALPMISSCESRGDGNLMELWRSICRTDSDEDCAIHSDNVADNIMLVATLKLSHVYRIVIIVS